MKKQTSQLREMLGSKEIVVAPGVYSAFPAIIAENVGFNAVYMSGYTTSAILHGMPDLGLITMTEMVLNACRINEVVNIPIIADCDNGYGNALNVIRSVKAYEKAGVAAIQIEDQVFPKKCGHLDEKNIIKAEEMVGKIKAAQYAREDQNLLIIARTDARTVVGFDEAVNRGNLYAQAGSDIVFIESPLSEEEMIKIPQLIKAPVMANMVENGKTPILSNQDLEDMGYSLVIWPDSTAFCTARSITKTLEELKVNKTTEGIINDEMITWDMFNKLVDAPKYMDLSKKFKS